MLTVICGEDVIASRQYLQSLKENYKKKNYFIQTIAPNQIEEVYKNTEGVISLFGQPKAYIVQNLSTKYSKRSSPALAKIIEELATNKEIVIIDWEEEKSAYLLTTLKKIATEFKEFKPQKTIFQLLDACYPNNRKDFLKSLQVVNQTQEPTFIFAMLCKHIRNLILAKENVLDSKISPWQKTNLSKQAQLWNVDKLISFYEGLARIDISIKTSATPFDLKESLDILACYYL